MKETTKVFDNLLNNQNQRNWQQLQQVLTYHCIMCVHCYYLYLLKTSPNTSQSLVNNTEQFGVLLGATLNNKAPTAIKARRNIGKYFHVMYIFLYFYTLQF